MESHEPNIPQPAIESKTQERKQQIKWPRSCEKKEWEVINTDISKLLGQLRGIAVKKLERMGDLIYDYGVDHFGTTEKKEENTNQYRKVQETAKDRTAG